MRFFLDQGHSLIMQESLVGAIAAFDSCPSYITSDVLFCTITLEWMIAVLELNRSRCFMESTSFHSLSDIFSYDLLTWKVFFPHWKYGEMKCLLNSSTGSNPSRFQEIKHTITDSDTKFLCSLVETAAFVEEKVEQFGACYMYQVIKTGPCR
ncbi:hypothetical protein BD770DRAFT_414494 [Pilaira anomala]|nr:hypothetical protein BD770DRAFT_414494 [Pilaira anomala]